MCARENIKEKKQKLNIMLGQNQFCLLYLELDSDFWSNGLWGYKTFGLLFFEYLVFLQLFDVPNIQAISRILSFLLFSFVFAIKYSSNASN
jgi:hypothetical protein